MLSSRLDAVESAREITSQYRAERAAQTRPIIVMKVIASDVDAVVSNTSCYGRDCTHCCRQFGLCSIDQKSACHVSVA
jgi:hypothetical protein